MQGGTSLFRFKRSWIFFIAAAWQSKDTIYSRSYSFPRRDCRKSCTATSRPCGGYPPIADCWRNFLARRRARREQRHQHREHLARTAEGCGPLRHSPGKPVIRWYQQFPSKPLWDFTPEAACELNKYRNIFVRQLH